MQDQTKDRGTGKPLVGTEVRGVDVAQTLGRVLRCQKSPGLLRDKKACSHSLGQRMECSELDQASICEWWCETNAPPFLCWSSHIYPGWASLKESFTDSSSLASWKLLN